MSAAVIRCDCSACNGLTARLDSARMVGITPTMVHNYVQAAHHMAPAIAARMGVSK